MEEDWSKLLNLSSLVINCDVALCKPELPQLCREKTDTMTDMNRGIMKFKGADSTPAVMLSALLILGSIAFLIVWALQSAYAFG